MSSSVTAIAAGDYFSLAVQNGNVFAWGDNSVHELGDGTTTGSLIPKLIDPTHLTNIISVAANGDSSYALSSDGSLWVWGANNYGGLGLGTNLYATTPQHILPPKGYLYTAISGGPVSFDVAGLVSPIPEPSFFAFIALVPVLLWRGRYFHSPSR